MYDYTVYKDTKGQTFVDNLITRCTYVVLDPGKYVSNTFYYSHRSLKGSPLLYASISTTAPTSTTRSASCGVVLYSGETGTLVNSMTITPIETTVGKDLVVPNDIYIGASKEWRIHVDTNRKAFIFQRKSSLNGQYLTEFAIQSDST